MRQASKLVRAPTRTVEHAFEGFLNVRGRAERKPSDDGTGCKNLRIYGQHRRRHRAASRETCDENAAAIHAMLGDCAIDHLPDRHCFASITGSIAGLEPVEAIVGVVGLLLL